MKVNQRPFRPGDVADVGKFLVAHYQLDNRDGNWLRPAWDYMHSHPNLQESALGLIAVWEDGKEIVGVVHFEDQPGAAHFQFHPEYPQLKSEMLAYAQEYLPLTLENGKKQLRIYSDDFDSEFETLAAQQGFQRLREEDRIDSRLIIPGEIPASPLPAGFRIKSLAEDNDLVKIHRALWRGFDHPGEPPQEGIHWRLKMQSSPNFRQDLTLVVENPAGNFVVYCGMWVVPENGYGYIEPLATDPDFRRLGLARAAVWEGIRRCQEEGAEVIYVGSDQPFYLSLGFERLHQTHCWQKRY
jgi:predicted N-acetyltransferase YhbS